MRTTRLRANAGVVTCAAIAASAILALTPGSSPARTGAAAPGPKLTVPAATLAGALTCPKPLRHPKKDPVLLLPATGATGPETWSWNYAITLPRAGYAVCIVTLPDYALGDIPTASQYVVAAIRRMVKQSGRQDLGDRPEPGRPGGALGAAVLAGSAGRRRPLHRHRHPAARHPARRAVVRHGMRPRTVATERRIQVPHRPERGRGDLPRTVLDRALHRQRRCRPTRRVAQARARR